MNARNMKVLGFEMGMEERYFFPRAHRNQFIDVCPESGKFVPCTIKLSPLSLETISRKLRCTYHVQQTVSNIIIKAMSRVTRWP